MSDFLNNPFVNAGMGLGGGIGAMPIAAPYTTAGVIPGAAMQFGGTSNAIPYMAGMLGGSGVGAGAMAMQPDQSQQAEQQQQDSAMSDQDKMAAYRMMAQGIQGTGRGMQMQMPSGNTAQIIRDNNQFRFAGTPQQQMANALRRR